MAAEIEVQTVMEGTLSEVGGPGYLSQLLSVAEKRAGAVQRAKLVRDAHRRREVLNACDALRGAFSAPGETSVEANQGGA